MSILNTGHSTSVNSMFWVRELFWLSVIFNFHLVASYVPSKANVVPDFLSRFFYQKRVSPIPPFLTWDLCCFKSGRVADPVANVSR